jgi:hypothetical protein
MRSAHRCVERPHAAGLSERRDGGIVRVTKAASIIGITNARTARA